MKQYKNKIKYNKTYFEIYAKKTLEYYYDKSWKNCFSVTEEKPDLQSDELDIGIEVTRVLQKRDGKIDSIFNDYISKNIDFERLENDINSLGGFVCKIGESTVMSHSKGLTDFQNNIDNLIYTIKKKTIEKLPNYKNFAKNMLYVFTSQALYTEFDIKEAFTLLNQELCKIDLKFDLYFLNCFNKIYIINSVGNIIDILTLEENMLIIIKNEALNES